MHRTETSAVRSVVSELQTLLHNLLARYVSTFSTTIQTAYQSTVPSQKRRTVQAYRTFKQNLRGTQEEPYSTYVP